MIESESVHIHESIAEGRLTATVFDAINDEHAISLAAHALTNAGYGDAEFRGIGGRKVGRFGPEILLVYEVTS
jgi:hypothetical protein